MKLRELDCLIAEKVFGWTNIGQVACFGDEHGKEIDSLPYSFDGFYKINQTDAAGLPPERKERSGEQLAGVDPKEVNGASLWCLKIIPSYSTDIAAAMTVAESGDRQFILGRVGETYSAMLQDPITKAFGKQSYAKRSLTIAICLDALACVGVKLEEKDIEDA